MVRLSVVVPCAQVSTALTHATDTEVNPEAVFQLLTNILNEDLLYALAINIHKLPFESRKDAQVIFSTAFRYKPAGQPTPQVLEHVVAYRPDIIIALCRGYDRRESAMPCGGILREALKYDAIAALLLYDEPMEDGKTLDLGSVNPDLPSSGNGVFWKFFGWIDKGAFEVSADAFNTFRVRTDGLRILGQVIDTLTGNPDQTQAIGSYVPTDQFRRFFLKVQHNVGPVGKLRNKASIYQVTGRDSARPSQLQRHDPIRRLWRASQDHHEAIARRQENDQLRGFPRLQGEQCQGCSCLDPTLTMIGFCCQP